MNKHEILNCICNLAKSQGCYTRLYKDILEDNSILDYLEEQKFKNAVDMILFLES